MNAVPGCQNASAGRSLFAGWEAGYHPLFVATVLAFLCGLAASLHAQTAVYNAGGTSTISTAFKGPMGVTTDASGNIFVADNAVGKNTATVYELTRTAPGVYGTPVALPAPAGGFICPASITEPDPCLRGIAVDSHGNVWVAAFGNYPTTKGNVYEWVNNSGVFATPVTVGTGWQGPWGVAADLSGNVFVTDNLANTISKISLVSGAEKVTTAAAANVVDQPRGIAVDSSDNIFVIDGNQDHFMELTPPYTSENALTYYSLQGPGDLARDANGNLWASEFNTNLIREETAGSDVYATILGWGSGMNGPVSVFADSDGTVLVSDFFNHAVKLISTGAVSMGTVAVGSTSATQTVQFTFTGSSSTKIQAPVIVTQGATGLDFADAGTGTCTTKNGTGNPYSSGSTCTVIVNFKPKFSGPRYGAVKLLNTSGTVLASALIYGAGSGPQLSFGPPAAPTTLGGGFSTPEGVAVDGSGNVYLADTANNAVKEAPSGCVASSCVTTLGGGLSGPATVALDGFGNLYVADSGNHAVKQIPPACVTSSCVKTLGGGFTTPSGVAVDGSGNVFVSDSGTNTIYRMAPSCASSSCVIPVVGETAPGGLAADGNGNLYVAQTTGAVLAIPRGCTSASCVVPLGGGFASPRSVAVDASGGVDVADYGNNSVVWVPAGCASSSCVITLEAAVSKPAGLALDGSGNLYVTSAGSNTLAKLSLATPPSVSFASTHQGLQSTDSPEPVTVRNVGNMPLTFPVPGTGTNPSISANFKLDSSTTCPEVLTSSSAGTLAAGVSCQLGVDFIPTTTGQISGSVVLTDNNLNASPSVTQSMGLSGTGLTKILTPTVTVTPSPSSITTTQSTSVTVTLSGGSGNPVPTGTVSLSGPGLSTSPLTLSSGSAIFNIPLNTLSVGIDTVTASYSGDSNYSTGTGSTSVTVTKTTPTMTASANPTAITTVQSTVVTISVAGAVQPTGTITLTSGGVTVGSGSLASGAAQITVAASVLAVGADTVTASYSGDSNYITATGSASVTVTKATPTVTVSPNPSAITTVQSTVMTVSVSGTPQATGTITLTSGGVTVGSGSLASGTAQITVSASALAVGTDTLNASYSGDSNYTTATGSGSVTVTKATPTVSVSPNPTTTTTLQSTVVTVSVGGTPQPTGTITLTSGGVTVGSGPLASGTAQIAVSASVLAVGTNTLTASYSGDSNYTTATGSSSVTVTKATPTVSASANPTGITTLQSTVVTVSVNGSTQPTGTITLTSGGVTVGSGSLVAGAAQINVAGSALAVGTDTLTASYSGDGVYTTATGSTSVTVTKATPTVSASANPISITTLDSTVVTVSVNGTPQPTGTITLSSGGVTVGSGSLVAGVAQINVAGSALGAGTDTLTASYSGDGVYTTATGSTSVTVSKATPTVSVNPSSSTITNSQTWSVTLSVSGGSGNPVPTGTISLTGGGLPGSPVALTGGSATISIPANLFPLGTNTVTGTYSGDSNYSAASGSTVITVTKATPTLSDVSASPSSITTLQSTVIGLMIGSPQVATGTITITSGDVTLGSANLAGGLLLGGITVPGSALQLGTNTLTISYSGDSFNYPASTATTVTVNAPVYPDNNVGAVNLGSTNTTPITILFNSPSTVGSIQVLTQGAQGLDFTNAGTGNCIQSGTYHVGDTCTVNVIFAPKFAGARYGAVNVRNIQGAVVATAYMYGTGVGPQVVFPGNTGVQTLGGGFKFVIDAAVDASGNVYVADSQNNAVMEIPLGCTSAGCVITVASGFTPVGVAVDGSDNIYVTDATNSAVKEISAGCTTSSCVTTLGGGFYGPNFVAVDGNGNVYVTDVDNTDIPQGSGWVKKIPPGCSSSSCVTSVISGGSFSYPQGLAVDGSGNLYVVENGHTTIDEIPAHCTSTSCVTTWGAYGGGVYIAVDGSGNVYPGYMAVDQNGNLYQGGNNVVDESNLATPPSLSFATTNMGSQSSDSPQAVTLRNIGNGALTFPVPGTGENPSVSASFTLDGSTTCPEVLSSGSAGTLAAGASCELAVDFIPATTGSITGSAVLTDNTLNANPAVTQSIGLSGAGATPIVPYIQVNGGAWQQLSSVTVNGGDTVNLAGQNLSGGTWSWTGPNPFTASTREIDAVPLTLPTNTFTVTYTNTSGVTSTQAFTVTVNPTAVVPWLQVNGGAWQQTASIAVNVGDTVNLAGQNISGGSWSWTGPSFTSSSRQINAVLLPSPTNVYNLTYTNAAGVASSPQAFTITVNSTPVVPYLQVNGGAWQQVASIAVNVGDTVNLAGQQQSTGTWSWTGPSSFTASGRVINSVSLLSATNVYNLTYTNASAVATTQAFTITVNSTPAVPYLQVNGGAWQQASSVTVNLGDTVNLAGQNISTGTWSWTGPNSFAASTRAINGVPLPSGTTVYNLTYTNAAGVASTPQAFTITVNSTPVVPYLQVNGGAWLQASSVAVNLGDTVNLAGQNISTGTWSWTGPNSFAASTREIDAVPLTLPTNTFTVTYTNTSGVTSTLAFTVTVNSTPLTPYIQVNGGAWQQTSTIAVNVGDTVNLAPLNISGGTWSWTGPNSFAASTREVDAVPLTSPSTSFTVTYTNTSGVPSTQTFTITSN